MTSARSVPVSRRDGRVQTLTIGALGEPRVLSEGSATQTDASLVVTSPGEVKITALSPSVPLPAPPVAPPDQVEVERLLVEPLNADLSRLHVTVSKGLLRKLEEVRDAMSHAMPGATDAELLEAGLDLLLAQAAKRRRLVDRPQEKVRPSKADHIPAHVRREVWKRDEGKCQWPLASGGICAATRDLELDHIHPRSRGGASTADNLRVTCRFHNGLAARLALGDDLMNRYTAGPRGAGPRRGEGRPRASGAVATSPP